MKFSLMQKGQENSVIEITREVFDEIVAPQYTQEGIDEFYRFASVESLCKRNQSDHFTIIAANEDKLSGIIEVRELKHISMFFVKKELQNKGIGKALFKNALNEILKRNPEVKLLTVNSSLNAVDAYKRLGFETLDNEQCFNGIKFIPMELKL